MPNNPINIVLEKDVKVRDSFFVSYPAHKTANHFFSSMRHTLSVDGHFFRSPKDFVIILHKEDIEIIWRGKETLKKGTLINLLLEESGGEFYFDAKTGVVVQNMVPSALYMVTLDAPLPANSRYYLRNTNVPAKGALPLAHNTPDVPRTVSFSATDTDKEVTFRIVGEDYYDRKMVEEVTVASKGKIEGRKAFKTVHRIIAQNACKGKFSVGTGKALGLPTYIPSAAFLLKEMFYDEEVLLKGKIIAGDNKAPSAISKDRRGLYVPAEKLGLDGEGVIRLLVSLPNPGHIGAPDFTGHK